MKKTEAVKRLLEAKTLPDLASLYNYNMEVQVNVAQDGGTRVSDEYKGVRWHGWTDGLQIDGRDHVWKSFRIPYKANTNPEYADTELNFDLESHVEAIGLTGWDWVNKVSKWVAFDFDAVVGHAKGLTQAELDDIIKAAEALDWITIRKSTSGNGLHLYVFLNNVNTETHTEHAALARSVLGKIAAITGYEFESKVDMCGGIMWVWHRKMIGTDGLTLIKSGGTLYDIPLNWRDHIDVVSGRSRKTRPQVIEERNIDAFEELTGQCSKVPLDSEHKALINYLRDNEFSWWWDQDHHMLVTHTKYIQQAFNDLGLRGYFKTISPGTDPTEQNCFMFPMRKGAWSVRRYTRGVQEDVSWDQDGAGWTRCFLNRDPDLSTAAKAYGGVEDPSGGFVFPEAELAVKTAKLLGTSIDLRPNLNGRKATLKHHKDGRLIMELEKNDNDTPVEGWLAKKGNWVRVYNARIQANSEAETDNYDDIIRHVVTTTNDDYGWMIKTDGAWKREPLAHVKLALATMGVTGKEITTILGSSVLKCWKLVNKPFQPEYPGDREWNRNAAQLRFVPTTDLDNLHYPTWKMLLQHCGRGLDEAIEEHKWCKDNGILTGADYLKCWIASLLQYPLRPLPYLFMYGPENSGKSIFHEALRLLLTRGYKRAEAALRSSAGFNAELEGAIICVVEEVNLRTNKFAYDRVKDWVTAKDVLIHEKGRTPYHVENSTHWIQAANNHQYCPIFIGDTRITMAYVAPPEKIIPKPIIESRLEKEAPDFLAEVMNLQLPEPIDRLNVPTIQTVEKSSVEQLNQTPLEMFVFEFCEPAYGYSIKFSDFYGRYVTWCEENTFEAFTKIRASRELPPQFPKARRRKDGQLAIGNIKWKGTDKFRECGKYTVYDGYLKECMNGFEEPVSHEPVEVEGGVTGDADIDGSPEVGEADAN